MIKLINILKEIKVFKPLVSISTMYNDVKPIMAEYMNTYEVIGNIEIDHNGDHYYDFTGEFENGDLNNNLAYDLAEYDGFTGGDVAFTDNVNVMYYYNVLANAFLLKYALEIGVLKFPFHAGFEERFFSERYNNGDIFNYSHLKELEKYRGQF